MSIEANIHEVSVALGISDGVIKKSNHLVIPHPHNRIIFGAPGTGKSHRLNNQQKEWFSDKQTELKLSIEEIVAKELANVGNTYSKCFALGFEFSAFFKGKKPKFIKETYRCSETAAYITSQGERCKDFYNSLPDYKDEEITVEKIQEQLKKLEIQKNFKEAGSAAVGRKYSSYLYGKTISAICEELELIQSQSQSTFIWYGAQSVGYTFENQKSESIKRIERVTFHPNYSYAQFVGSYKPVTRLDTESDKEQITYEYVHGPFMRVFVNAVQNPSKKFLLLIEEINRANVAAVFGDVFQLLDRNSDGSSEYPIVASEDIKKYLSTKGLDLTEISLPPNMYIWATMNSADQGVLPMDAAFKRRWEFEYIGIDDGESGIDPNLSAIQFPNGTMGWNKLRHLINNRISTKYNINEDKLLGPFFIKKGNQTDEEFCKSFKSKVLMYLFEDVCKINPRALFSGIKKEKIHFSDVVKEFDSAGLGIFDFSEEELKSVDEQLNIAQTKVNSLNGENLSEEDATQ